MDSKLTLVGHVLCPYVQRVVIVLEEKGILYERIDIDLSSKPEWFLEISPLGRTPVLLVNGKPIFESAVICEYLEETTQKSLHPQEALLRASHRGWIEFASETLSTIGAIYRAVDTQKLQSQVAALQTKFEQLETELSSHGREGDFFSGATFSIVDAAFAPVFRYFDIFDEIEMFEFFTLTPKVKAWRIALKERLSVQSAVHPDYPNLLRAFLMSRNSEISRLLSSR
jgi:glutathione S-transferase